MKKCKFWKLLGGGRARPAPIAATGLHSPNIILWLCSRNSQADRVERYDKGSWIRLATCDTSAWCQKRQLHLHLRIRSAFHQANFFVRSEFLLVRHTQYDSCRHPQAPHLAGSFSLYKSDFEPFLIFRRQKTSPYRLARRESPNGKENWR